MKPSFKVVAADAGGYYSLRSAELRDGKTPFTSSRYDFSFDYQKEKNEAEKWLAAKLNPPECQQHQRVER